MGNEQSNQPGPQDPNLVNTLKKNTPFTNEEAQQIARRYQSMDPEGEGMSIKDCKMMPEFTANVFAPDVIEFYADKTENKVFPRNFASICALFCRRTPAQKKKEFLFDLFDVNKQRVLGHDAMFRIFKLFFSHAISDDHILALVFSALRYPQLDRNGEVSRNEFLQMVSDSEIQERMSIDFTITS